jgi:mannose-6-phosphate isomerase-like protein (cupin superfamily)
MKKSAYVTMGVLGISLEFAIGAGPVMAKDVAPSYVEDPGVYKLISENEDFRVIMATWKPGQRDAWHSHAGAATSYRLTDCTMRAHTPDGKSVSRDGKLCEIKFIPIITSHSLENVGTSDCQVLIVEKK